MINKYNSNDIANNIRVIARKKNITLSVMFSEIGLGKNTLMNFKKSMPKADNLAKIADYLNCSVDELLCRDTITGISETEDIMLKNFRKLNATQQEALIKLITKGGAL